MNDSKIFFLKSIVLCLIPLNGYSQDIIFSKNCLDATVHDLKTSDTLASNEILELNSIQIRAKNEAEVRRELLQNTQVKFPSGKVVDMHSHTTVSSHGAIFEEFLAVSGYKLNSEEYYRAYIKRYESKKAELQFGNGSFDEFLALVLYKGDGYRDINRGLRWQQFKDKQHEKAFIKVVEYMNSALNRIKPYQGYVKRGASLPPEQIEQFQKGNFFSFQTYVSTSLKPAPLFISAKEANRVVFILKSKTGRPIEDVVRVNSSSPGTNTWDEGEVIFKPQTAFKVLEVKKNPDGPTKIYAEEVALK